MSGAGSLPIGESLSFSFSTITETTAGQSTSWDTNRGLPQGPAVPPEPNFTPLPDAPDTGIELVLSGGNAPAATIALDTFNYGFLSGEFFGGPGGSNRAQFSILNAIAPLSDATTKLLSALTTGNHDANASLIQ